MRWRRDHHFTCINYSKLNLTNEYVENHRIFTHKKKIKTEYKPSNYFNSVIQ